MPHKPQQIAGQDVVKRQPIFNAIINNKVTSKYMWDGKKYFIYKLQL